MHTCVTCTVYCVLRGEMRLVNVCVLGKVVRTWCADYDCVKGMLVDRALDLRSKDLSLIPDAGHM